MVTANIVFQSIWLMSILRLLWQKAGLDGRMFLFPLPRRLCFRARQQDISKTYKGIFCEIWKDRLSAKKQAGQWSSWWSWSGISAETNLCVLIVTIKWTERGRLDSKSLGDFYRVEKSISLQNQVSRVTYLGVTENQMIICSCFLRIL